MTRLPRLMTLAGMLRPRFRPTSSVNVRVKRWAVAGSLLAGASILMGACYASSEGTAPVVTNFYFPLGLAVSNGGNVLYVANSDFDLQYNGGFVFSLNLFQLRIDIVKTIASPSDPSLVDAGKLVYPPLTPIGGPCPAESPPVHMTNGSGARQPLGWTCAPPVKTTSYIGDSAVIGAFVTDLQLSTGSYASSSGTYNRLFAPVRGSASLTWFDVQQDPPIAVLPGDTTGTGAAFEAMIAAGITGFPPLALNCGTRDGEGRCNVDHQAGVSANEQGNPRHLTVPGELFGMAQSQDGASLILTHQTTSQVSLFTTGLPALTVNGTSAASDAGTAVIAAAPPPALQYILNTGVPVGGNGVALIPHDPYAFPNCVDAGGGEAGAVDIVGPGCPPRPAFLMTNRYLPGSGVPSQLSLIRYYATDGTNLSRPLIAKETSFPLTISRSTADARGIAIDPSPRIRCENTSPNVPFGQCSTLPSRLFVANRLPPSLLVGQVRESIPLPDGTYALDEVTISKTIPLLHGPSRVYLAPIVDKNGKYALRVFVVCYEAKVVFIYDPDADVMENIVQVGVGPYAMTFDPFDVTQVALGADVGIDYRPSAVAASQSSGNLKLYRFAYIASFAQSFLQVIDLDNSLSDKSTYETVVFTLGLPTNPAGAQ